MLKEQMLSLILSIAVIDKAAQNSPASMTNHLSDLLLPKHPALFDKTPTAYLPPYGIAMALFTAFWREAMLICEDY